MIYNGYAGSYRNDHHDLMKFRFDDEKEQFLYCREDKKWKDTKYLSYQDHILAAVTKEEKAGVILYDDRLKRCEKCLMEEITPCFILQDASYIYTANYHEGCMMIYRKDENLKVERRIDIQKHAGCHQILLYKNYVFVICLLLDQIMIYDTKQDFLLVRKLSFPKGSGPRHGVIIENQMYVLSELSTELFIFNIHENLTFIKTDQIQLCMNSKKGSGAAIRISKDHRFLYMSVREINQIILFDCVKRKIIQKIDSYGDHPRDLCLSPNEKHVFVIHRNSGNISVFRRNPIQGTLCLVTDEIRVEEGVSLVFESDE